MVTACGRFAGTWPETLPSDMERLGLTVASADSWPRRSADDAIEAAAAEAPGLFELDGIDVSAYLTVGSASTLTWVVRVTGFEFFKGGPPDQFGSPAPGHTLRYAYLYVDDATGEAGDIVMRQ